MSKYLITLTPIDKFFFGGEITFNRSKLDSDKGKADLTPEEKNLKEFDEKFSSYIVKSNPFPQQTSLLGMLRFLLLSNEKEVFADNKIIRGKESEVSDLIGKTSFGISLSDFSEMKFGKIKNVFPCFIQRKVEGDDWTDLIFAPMDYQFKKVSFEKGVSLLDVKKTTIPIIDEYNNSKEGIPTLYINADENIALKESELFVKDARIGIDRDFKGKTKPGAFYKQVFYRFADKPEHRFAFYADLDYEFPADKNFIVSLGGDNSRFNLQAKIVESIPEIKLSKQYEDKKNFDNCHSKIVLLSDAFVEKEALSNCLFSINDTIAFRFLTSDVNTQNYYKFTGNNHLQRNNVKYNLYKKGSVFYFADEKQLEKFEVALKKDRFVQIGYNHYKSIKK